jgi:putative hydrolase of the HAD superfamily
VIRANVANLGLLDHPAPSGGRVFFCPFPQWQATEPSRKPAGVPPPRIRGRGRGSYTRPVTDRVVFWDFDGTLVERPGAWSAVVMEVLNDAEPGHGITLDRLRDTLQEGFPWHRADIPHPELSKPDEWWRAVIGQRLAAVGLADHRVQALVALVRERFTDPAHGWKVFPDTVPALSATAAAGWRNVILSNHVPELANLVTALGLDHHLDDVLTSALTGFEKPHPESYRLALRKHGNPTAAFMVGDNPIADVRGAEAIGLPAILVRGAGEARLRADGLEGAAAIILAG